MKIALNYRRDIHDGKVVPSYSESVRRELVMRGHEVFPVGEGHDNQLPGSPYPIVHDQLSLKYFDFVLELDNGRNKAGSLGFGEYNPVSIPRAIWFIDSHGQPTLHKRLAKDYTHVFFAVWSKRDLFASHGSAHWCPNATDAIHFPRASANIPTYDFGFFGSKGGLDRAKPLQEICERHGWSADVRQINGPFKPKWPFTAEAMWGCTTLFNHGQKHDGPNLRVMESMAVGRPLITDMDPQSGMSKLFVEGEHYLGYESYTYKGLEEKMLYAKAHPGWCLRVANQAYDLVMAKHQIGNRVDQMLEVFNANA